MENEEGLKIYEAKKSGENEVRCVCLEGRVQNLKIA